MKKVCYQLSPFPHVQVRRDPCTNQVQICLKNGKSSRDLENERIRVLLERQKEQILAEVRSEIQKHEIQADGQGDGVPKAGRQQASADSRGSRTCVCANPLVRGVAHARREG